MELTERRKLSRKPTAEIISVGNELLIGHTLDTNSHWIAKHLTRLGWTLERVTQLRDSLDSIKSGVQGSLKRNPGRKLVIPPDNKSIAELAPKENARLRSELEPTDRDLILIGFGKDPGRALAGALAAVLSLQKA